MFSTQVSLCPKISHVNSSLLFINPPKRHTFLLYRNWEYENRSNSGLKINCLRLQLWQTWMRVVISCKCTMMVTGKLNSNYSISYVSVDVRFKKLHQDNISTSWVFSLFPSPYWPSKTKLNVDHLITTDCWLLSHLLIIYYFRFSIISLLRSYVSQKLNRPIDTNVSVFRGKVDVMLNFTESQTLGITLAKGKPAKVET